MCLESKAGPPDIKLKKSPQLTIYVQSLHLLLFQTVRQFTETSSTTTNAFKLQKML
jgi:hypothetical protein